MNAAYSWPISGGRTLNYKPVTKNGGPSRANELEPPETHPLTKKELS